MNKMLKKNECHYKVTPYVKPTQKHSIVSFKGYTDDNGNYHFYCKCNDCGEIKLVPKHKFVKKDDKCDCERK